MATLNTTDKDFRGQIEKTVVVEAVFRRAYLYYGLPGYVESETLRSSDRTPGGFQGGAGTGHPISFHSGK